MQIEALGLIVLLAGVASLVLDYRWAIFFAFAFTIFGAAAAVLLPVLGGATITPPHLFSGFVILKALIRQNGPTTAAKALALRRPGGWLACVVGYGIFVSVLSPGLFPDTLVYAFGRLESGVTVRLEPLTRGAGQITQDIYAVGSVLLFATGVVLLRRAGASKYVLHGFVACAVLNLVFVVLDVGSFYAGYPDLLAFVRTGGYAQLYSNTEGGVKRIVGSFPEASSFAGYSCILFGFWASLWMQRYRTRLSGTLAFLTLVAMLLSTSSTAYVAVTIFFMLFITSELVSLLSKKRAQRLVFIFAAVPLLIFLILAATLLRPEIVDIVTNMIDETVFNKLNTASGIERFAWNSQAWQNFLDTYGVGIGIGGGRASSYVLILLSNVGLLGTIAFAVYVYKVFSFNNFYPNTGDERAVGTACRWAFAGSLITSTLSAGVFEIGVLPYLAAAGAAAIGFRETAPKRHLKLARFGRPSNEFGR
jgi:hypothetical protein